MKISQIKIESLRLLANKLRCLGHFLETQDPDHVYPADFDKVQHGVINADQRNCGQNIENFSRS